MEKLYHFYIDEGGMFGDARVLVVRRKLRFSENNSDVWIGYYYFGKLSLSSIISHLHHFQGHYPKCNILILHASDVSIIKPNWEIRPGM